MSDLTDLPEASVKQCLLIQQKNDHIPFEVLEENGLEPSAHIKTPEETVLANEKTKMMNEFLANNTTEEELQMIRFWMNPDDPSKDKATYKEISDKSHLNPYYVKKIFSKIEEKIKSDRQINGYML